MTKSKDEYIDTLRVYAVRLLASRPRSISEMRQKLVAYEQKRSYPETVTQLVIDELVEKNLLNDTDFVLWWKEQRDTHRPKGSRAIKSELLQKGIDRSTIDETLASTDLSDEYQQALELATKKLRFITAPDQKIIEKKIGGLLTRRGFGWETVARVIDSLSKND